MICVMRLCLNICIIWECLITPKDIKQYMSDLVGYGLLIPLIPDNPGHSNQKFVSVRIIFILS